MDRLSHPHDAHRERLDRIAQALGLSVSAFTDERPGEMADLLTLIRLWAATPDAQGRRRVLNLARIEARRCGYGDDARGPLTGEPR